MSNVFVWNSILKKNILRHKGRSAYMTNNSPKEKFDAIIIGTGQAGPSLANRLSQAGMRIAIIERKQFGGTCVNTGCTPTKSLVANAKAAHIIRKGASFWNPY